MSIEATGILFKNKETRKKSLNTAAKNAKRLSVRLASLWITEVMF